MTYAARKKSTKTTIGTAVMIKLSAVDSGRTFRSFIRRVFRANRAGCFCDCHFSEMIASLCAIISFIRSLSPLAGSNRPAKARAVNITNLLLYKDATIQDWSRLLLPMTKRIKTPTHRRSHQASKPIRLAAGISVAR
jgi:hypothetical protein